MVCPIWGFRPDHGSNGAYPSWPAFSVEALCYLDGNCSSAFEIMATFAETTYEGPFGQANEVPQLGTAPFTPFDEPAFKPIAGVNRYNDFDIIFIIAPVAHARRPLPPTPSLSGPIV